MHERYVSEAVLRQSDTLDTLHCQKKIFQITQMSGVIITELDNSSEESFDTPKSSHSADEFHEPAESLQDNTSMSVQLSTWKLC